MAHSGRRTLILILDFVREWSGGPSMAVDPTNCDSDDPKDPEARFLVALWRHLDAASDISIDMRVIERLGEVRENCEMAIALISAWQTEQH